MVSRPVCGRCAGTVLAGSDAIGAFAHQIVVGDPGFVTDGIRETAEEASRASQSHSSGASVLSISPPR
jgi:hypothetical protein